MKKYSAPTTEGQVDAADAEGHQGVDIRRVGDEADLDVVVGRRNTRSMNRIVATAPTSEAFTGVLNLLIIREIQPAPGRAPSRA